MSHKQALLDQLNNRTATLGIVGLGYVGLPLAVEFAKEGFNVIGLDVHQGKVDSINNGESYIPDIPTEELKPLVKSGKLRATTKYSDLSNVNTINICVPTPLIKNKDPDMSYIHASMDALTPVIKEGTLIILESTTYPGTTEEIIAPKLEAAGFEIGETAFVAFSPERIDPGNKTYAVHNTPKVVGGVTPHCSELAECLYSSAIEKVVIVSSPATAEMSKLLENSFRAINIGFINEIALMCDKLNIDVWEVIDAAKTKPFGFMAFYPGPGLGGHCIPIDPHYLSWKLKTLNYDARFIELASDINDFMPSYVLGKIADALNGESKSIKGSDVVVLGVAYKRDIDDVRESPALDVIKLLQQKGANVSFHDPHVGSIRLEKDGNMASSDYSIDLLKNADCVVIITDHSTYDWQEIGNNASLIVDTRHVFDKDTNTKARIVSL